MESTDPEITVKMEKEEVEPALDTTDSKKEDESEEGSEDIDQKIRLVFVGTFDHESYTEPNVDMVQFKCGVRVTEIRIIPLGQEMILSNGSRQLGATNPSDLFVEFYYNDLRYPDKPVFTLLENFHYNDQSNIQLDCLDLQPEIITDAILIRGHYSTVTLTIHGYTLSEEIVKSLEIIPDEPDPESPTVGSPLDIKSPRNIADESMPLPLTTETESMKEEPIPVVKIEQVEESHIESPPPAYVKPEPIIYQPLVVEVPQAIPTISTRVNFSPIIKVQPQPQPELLESEEERIEPKAEPVSSDEEHFDDQSFKTEPHPSTDVIDSLLMETEDISDGEISDVAEDDKFEPSEGGERRFDESRLSPEKQRKPVRRENTIGVSGGAENEDVSSVADIGKVESPHELLSDQDDSFSEEFIDPAVEEIISDEEMPDYGDDDYNEWDELWPQKFCRLFNPFHPSHEIQQLRFLQIETYLRKAKNEDQFAASKLFGAISRFSEKELSKLDEIFIESWVEALEKVMPFLPHALNEIGEDDQEVLKAVRFWIRIGLDLNLAKNTASIKFKIRHISLGLKLVNCICNYGGCIAEEILKLTFQNNCSIQEKLTEILIEPQLRAIVKIQTLTLRTLDSTLSTRRGYNLFCTLKQGEMNPFQHLIIHLTEVHPKVRGSYSFKHFLSKVSLVSKAWSIEKAVESLLNTGGEESPQLNSMHISSLGPIISSKVKDFWIELNSFAHRCEPVLAVLTDTLSELHGLSPSLESRLSFIRMLRGLEVMKLCATLVTFKEGHEFVDPICDFLEYLLGWEEGLVYLCSEAEFLTLVIKFLLRFDEKRVQVAQFIYSLEIMRCIDELKAELVKTVVDEDDDDIQCLHLIHSFLNTPSGRESLKDTLSIGNLIAPFLQCIREADSRLANNSDKLSRLVNSARRGYVLDILLYVVKFADRLEFLRDRGPEIHELIISLSDHYEGGEKLNELLPFLKPTLEKIHFTEKGVEPLCHLIKGKLPDFLNTPGTQEQNWGFTPEVITALRILCHFAGSSHSDDLTTTTTFQRPKEDLESSNRLKDVKFMGSFIRMNSEDIMSDLTAILNKILQDCQHVAVQTYLLAGCKGDALISILRPVLYLFRKILINIIQVRDTEFRDVTAVPILLQVYSIMKAFPETSLSSNKAVELGAYIIYTLLLYAIPTIKPGEESEEALTKSVWTTMINEIIKFIWSSPANWVPGISALSELLPFPFPIQTNQTVTEDEKVKWVRQKLLWNAYLHGASTDLQELIGVMSESLHPELLSNLKQCCLKLADLSPSSCLMVCRAVMGQIFSSMESDFEKECFTTDSLAAPFSFVKAWVECTTEDRKLLSSPRTAKLLDFWASLISSHGLFKHGFMQICRASNKIDEKFADFVSMLCTILTSWPTKNLTVHAQAQRHVVTIFQAVCDVEFSLFLSGSEIGLVENTPSPEYIRSNSIPQKEMLAQICSAFLNYLNSFDLNIIALKASVAENVLHALQIISETEYGFYHLRTLLDRKPESLKNFAKKLAKPLTDENAISPMVEIVTAFTNFLNCLVTPKEDSENLTIRVNTLNAAELSKLLSPADQINIKNEDGSDAHQTKTESNKNVSHPLLQLKAELEKWIGRIDENQEVDQIYASLEGSLEILNKLFHLMSQDEKPSPVAPTEQSLAIPDPLTKIMDRRPISVLLRDQIPFSPWIITSHPPIFYEEIEPCTDNDLIKCDLMELAQMIVPGLDLVKEVESIFKRNLYNNLDEIRSPIEVVDLKLKTSMDFPYSRSGEGPFTTGLLGLSSRKPHFNTGMRGNTSRLGFGRGMNSGAGRPGPHGFDPFRSRPPNTSRPPSLHVDDFVAMESSGQGSGGGQPNFSKAGPRTGGIGRHSRGASSGRPFSGMDRSRPYPTRSPGSSYYQRNDGGQSNSGRGRGGRGRGGGGGGGNRWGVSRSDQHSPNQGFGSGGGGGPIHTRVTPAGRQSFSRSNNYREVSGRSAPSNNPSMNSLSAVRWRDRQKPFNR